MKARENVFSFLLANHPLDCPICDQAGECDLQDQTKNFANNSSRFFFKKRGVVDKSSIFGLKTIMTRCIHCTRCVRYTSLHTASLLGIFNRGSSSQIGQYSKKTQQSLINTNVVDYCPVAVVHDIGPKKIIDNSRFRKVQIVINFFVFASITFVITSVVIILFYRFVLHEEYLHVDIGVELKTLVDNFNILVTESKKYDTISNIQLNRHLVNFETRYLSLDYKDLLETYKKDGGSTFSRPTIVPT